MDQGFADPLRLHRELPGAALTWQAVRVNADDPAARPDIAAWRPLRSQEYLGEDLTDDGVPRFVVRRVR